MKLTEKVTEYFKSIDTSDEALDRFLDKEYKGMLQLCFIYLKYDKKNLPKTLLQYFFSISVIAYHWVFALQGLIATFGINFVLYSKGAYYFMFIQMSGIVIYTIIVYRDDMVKFHRNMSKNFYDYKEDDTEFIEILRKEMAREVKLLSIVPFSTGIGAVVVFVLSMILDRYGTYVVEEGFSSYLNLYLPVPIIAYQFSTHTTMGFFIAYVVQVFTGTTVIFTIAGGGYLYIVLVQNVHCQLKILINSIEKIEKRAADYYFKMSGLKMNYSDQKKFSDQLYDYCYNECLKKNIEHHQIILSSFDCLRKLFSVPIFTAYLTGSVVIALSLLSNNLWELPGTSLTSSVLGCIEVGFIASISFLGQGIIDLNEELRVKMYETRWYYCSNRTKTSIKILQQMTLKPLVIMSAYIVPINLDTFAVVMNSAYSYYNLINAFS